MTKYEYRVMPFMGTVKGSQGADVVAQQLNSLINQQATQGWEFVQVSDVNIEVKPGCLAAILGAKVSYIRFDQVVFRRIAG